MISKAIKCSGKKCKEAFHINDNIIHGGINDKYCVTIKCKKCGSLTKCILHNIDHLFQTDEYEIVDKREIDSDDDCSSIFADVGESALVDGYEQINEPLHRWDLYNSFSLWKNEKYDFEYHATCALITAYNEISHSWYNYYNAYLAGQFQAPEVNKVFVSHSYKIGKKKCKALWVSDFKASRKLYPKDLYLIHHNDIAKIDGIYSRDNSLKYLERLLVRWRALCNEVIVATPFIGYDFPFSKESDKLGLIALWELLNGLLDMDKTLFFTRSATYSTLKKNQNKLKIPNDVLKEWDLMTNLQKVVDNPKTRAKMKEKFHLKIYAGVFDNHIELFSGSYNVQTNETMENMCLRTLTREHFKTNYMDVMMDDFVYQEPNDENVLLITIDEHGHATSKISNMAEINKLTKK